MIHPGAELLRTAAAFRAGFLYLAVLAVEGNLAAVPLAVMALVCSLRLHAAAQRLLEVDTGHPLG